MENMHTRELISALADGRLEGEAFARGVELAASDPAARAAWQTYHLIGDVLRSGELAVGSMRPDLLERVQRRLRDEQVAVAALAVSQAVPAPDVRREPANDATFRWKLVAGLASVAAVGAMAWSLVGGLPGNPEAARLATAPGPATAPAGTVLTTSQGGVMIRSPQLDELLNAHRQLGGATALQMSGGFVRNATFEGASR
jgi:sigma-E factor negative regulatory protein RseA